MHQFCFGHGFDATVNEMYTWSWRTTNFKFLNFHNVSVRQRVEHHSGQLNNVGKIGKSRNSKLGQIVRCFTSTPHKQVRKPMTISIPYPTHLEIKDHFA